MNFIICDVQHNLFCNLKHRVKIFRVYEIQHCNEYGQVLQINMNSFHVIVMVCGLHGSFA